MKKWPLILALLPFAAFAQTKPKTTTTSKTVVTPKPPVTKGFTIEGKVDGFDEGTDVLMYKNGENVEMARTKIAKGKFVLKGTLSEPSLCFVIIGSEKPVEIFVENAIISMKGKKMQPPVYEIEGSASHKDFAQFLKNFMPFATQSNAISQTLNATPVGTEREKLMESYNTNKAGLQKVIDDFVTAKPKSAINPFILHATFNFYDDIVQLERRYNLMDAKLKTTEGGVQLRDFIADAKIGAIGTDAMDFSQPDTTGKAISLSSFRGKYVLIDFWASWCGPCRSENPNVVENFKKFSSKNFTVLGVSLDRTGQKEKWVSAINEDHLTWTHVSDLQWWSNSVALLYKVKSIPQNFLVDPQGKIVAKNLRGPDLEAKLCELLGCN